MKTANMPPGLRAYWQGKNARKRRVKQKIGVRRFEARARRVDAGVVHHKHHKAACSHATAVRCVSNLSRPLWCPVCGSIHDGHHWKRPTR